MPLPIVKPTTTAACNWRKSVTPCCLPTGGKPLTPRTERTGTARLGKRLRHTNRRPDILATETKLHSVTALHKRLATAEDAYRLTAARHKHGLLDYGAVLDSQRSLLQAKQQLATAQLGLNKGFVRVNKAVGNVVE